MRSQHISFHICKIAFRISFPCKSLYRSSVISVRDEAYVLTFFFLRVYKSVSLCYLTCLCLMHATEREFRVRKLELRKRVKHVALIFFLIDRLEQQPAAVTLFYPCIVPCYYIITVKIHSSIEETFEFQVSVTVYARIWSSAVLIRAYKIVYYFFPEIRCKVKYIIRYSQN